MATTVRLFLDFCVTFAARTFDFPELSEMVIVVLPYMFVSTSTSIETFEQVTRVAVEANVEREDKRRQSEKRDFINDPLYMACVPILSSKLI